MDTLGTFAPTGAGGSLNGHGTTHPTAAPPPPSAPPRLGPVRRRRRPALWGIGLVLVAGGGAVAAISVAAAGHRLPVLALARAVPAGQQLTAADLAVAHVAVDPLLDPVPAGEQGQVLGQLAAVDLRPGTLLTRSELTSVGIPAAGQALVGVSLKAGQLPARALARGDRVLAVETPDPTAAAAKASPVGGTTAPAGAAGRPAVVAEVGVPASDGTSVVDLVVNSGDGPALARDAAAGRLYLVLLPPAAGR